ncbi:MAG: tyrosine-type recombinase/integrase [Leptospiraceae bacterium]|jgi:integrase|nr:tyrosine-type recombinase/integrase [Leptospiraceae bacterium]
MTKTQEKVGRIPKIYKLPDDGVSKGYVDRIRVFNRFCRDKMGNKEIDDKTVIAFFEEMKLHKKATTLSTYIYSIKSAYLKICKTDLMKFKVSEFFKQIERPKLIKKISPNKLVTIEDLKKAMEDEKPVWKLLVYFIYNHALRVSEATNIRLNDIDVIKPGIVEAIVRGKGNRTRRIFFSEDYLNKIKIAFGSEMYLFEFQRKTQINRDTIRKKIQACFQKKLNRKFTTHWLRHSQANAMISDGKSIREIADYLGHSSPDITSAHYDQSGITPEMKVSEEIIP